MDIPSFHPLDAATRLSPSGPGRLRGRTLDDYWNMTGPWGGTTAATLLGAALGHPDRLGDPVAFTVNFCAPLVRGDFHVDIRETRRNRSSQHWSLELSQDGEGVAATASAVFAVRRETWAHRPHAMPDVPPAETLIAMPTEGRNAWLQRYDFRFAEGAPDFSPRPEGEFSSARSLVWLRDVPARPLDFLSLAALTDIFFVRIFQVRGYMSPASTVTMTSYFHVDAAELAAQGAAPVLGVADTKVFNKGYFDQSAELWSRDGRLLATTVQSVYFKT